jgi:hypothetical protein
VDLPASRIRLGLECVATAGARHRRTTAVQGCCCHRGGSSSVILFSQMNLWSSFFDFGHWRRVGVRDFGVREEKGRSEREGLWKGGILISFVPISSGSTA